MSDEDFIDDADTFEALRHIRPRPPRPLHSYAVTVPPKTLREAINVATVAIRSFYGSDHEYGRYLRPLEELGRECDRMRPTGPDGKHGDRHTRECGCGDNPLNRHACPECKGKGWSPTRSTGIEPAICDTCGGGGWVNA